MVGGILCSELPQRAGGTMLSGAGSAAQIGHKPAPRAHVWGWGALSGSFF